MNKVIYPVIGKQISLPIYLTGIGILEYEHHINRKNGLISHQFLYTGDGCGILNTDNMTYRLPKGSLFYMSPGTAHEYYPEGDRWSTSWIVFRGKHLDALMRELDFGYYHIKENIDSRPFDQLFGMILSAAEDPISGAEKCSLLLYEYILNAHRQLTEDTPASSGNAVSDAIAYINLNYCRDITLEDLYRRSGYSAQHFCRLFKAQVGMRPMEYIARYRISQAKILLLDSKYTIRQTGVEVGYPDPTYFGIVFKKYEGISPGEYRKRRNNIAI